MTMDKLVYARHYEKREDAQIVGRKNGAQARREDDASGFEGVSSAFSNIRLFEVNASLVYISPRMSSKLAQEVGMERRNTLSWRKESTRLTYEHFPTWPASSPSVVSPSHSLTLAMQLLPPTLSFPLPPLHLLPLRCFGRAHSVRYSVTIHLQAIPMAIQPVEVRMDQAGSSQKSRDTHRKLV